MNSVKSKVLAKFDYVDGLFFLSGVNKRVLSSIIYETIDDIIRDFPSNQFKIKIYVDNQESANQIYDYFATRNEQSPRPCIESRRVQSLPDPFKNLVIQFSLFTRFH